MKFFGSSPRRPQALGLERMEDRRLLAGDAEDLAEEMRISLASVEGGMTLGHLQIDTDSQSIQTVVMFPARAMPLATVVINAGFTIDTRLLPLRGLKDIPPSPSLPDSSDGGPVEVPRDRSHEWTPVEPLANATGASPGRPTRSAFHSEMARCIVLHVVQRPTGSGMSGDLVASSRRQVESGGHPQKRPPVTQPVIATFRSFPGDRGTEAPTQRSVVPVVWNPIGRPTAPEITVAVQPHKRSSTVIEPAPSRITAVPDRPRVAPTSDVEVGEEGGLPSPPPVPPSPSWWLRFVTAPAAVMIAMSGAYAVARHARGDRPKPHPMLRLRGVRKVEG